MDWQTIVLYLIGINLAAFVAFYIDKKAAVADRRRISEKTLLLLALIGGSVGAIIGQQVLRHKTYKQPFKFLLYSIVVLQVAILIAAVILGIETLSHQVYTLN